MRATPQEQRALLEVQALDTQIARLRHQRRTLPVLARLAELERVRGLHNRERVEAQSGLGDLRRELARVEADVAQIRTRSERHADRLAASTSSKDAQALQHEIDLLAARTSVLEDAELEQMEAVEQAEAALAQIEARLAEASQDIAAVAAERDAEFARIDVQLEGLATEREARAVDVPAELLALYDEVRADTGGLGAVALYGTRTEGAAVDFPLTELAEIKAAPADQVVTSQEHGYILVRMAEQ